MFANGFRIDVDTGLPPRPCRTEAPSGYQLLGSSREDSRVGQTESLPRNSGNPYIAIGDKRGFVLVTAER
ncbi:hypothetical protein [Nocardia xishanensis]